MSRRVRIKNLEPIGAVIVAEPEGFQFDLEPGGHLDLELLGGKDPVGLFLEEEPTGNRIISVWPQHGGFRLWKAGKLLWDSRDDAPDGEFLDMEFLNNSECGVFLITDADQVPHCLAMKVAAAVRFQKLDIEFVIAITKTAEGQSALRIGSKPGPASIVGWRVVR